MVMANCSHFICSCIKPQVLSAVKLVIIHHFCHTVTRFQIMYKNTYGSLKRVQFVFSEVHAMKKKHRKKKNPNRTRPDTRHQRRGRLGRGSNAKTARNSEMLRTDGRTDGRTNTARCRVACSRLNKDQYHDMFYFKH